MTWLLILTVLAISLACAFYGTTLLAWTIAVAAGIVVIAATGSVPMLSLVTVALVFGAIAAVLNVKPWRQQLISGPFLKEFRRMLPAISETEQVALDAATVRALGHFIEDDGTRFRFRHATVHEVAYEGLPYRRRRELHARAGETIERLAGQGWVDLEAGHQQRQQRAGERGREQVDHHGGGDDEADSPVVEPQRGGNCHHAGPERDAGQRRVSAAGATRRRAPRQPGPSTGRAGHGAAGCATGRTYRRSA